MKAALPVRVAAIGLAIILAVAGAPIAAAKGEPSISDVLDTYVDKVGTPGLALVTLANGQADTHTRGRDGAGRTVDENTRFRIASMSKSFTALAVMQQVDQDRLRLEDRVTTYVPALAEADSEYDSITIKQLLTHRSGIVETRPYRLDLPNSPKEVVAGLGPEDLATDPGTVTAYSNEGYALLARVIEVVTGVEFNRYLDEHVFAPLEMTATSSTNRCDDRPTDLARGHLVIGPVVPEMPGVCAGSGGVISTAKDMTRWLRFQLGDGTSPASGRRIVSADLLTAMHDVPNEQGRYGLGWQNQSTPGDKRWHVGHSGTLSTFNANIEFSPATGTGAVALGNKAGAPAVLTHNAVNAIDGGPQQQPTDPYDQINIVLLLVAGLVAAIAGILIWRAPRWAARRRSGPRWRVVLGIVVPAILALAGAALPLLLGALMGTIDLAMYYVTLWLYPLAYAVATAAFVGFGVTLIRRLRHCASRQARAASRPNGSARRA